MLGHERGRVKGTQVAASIVVAVAATLLIACPSGPAVRADEPRGGPLVESYAHQKNGDLKGAIGAMRTVVEQTPKAYFPKLRLAYLLLLQADYAAAAEAYGQAAAVEPGSVEPLLGQHQALIALERYDQADRIGREILSRDPKNYSALSRLAWSAYKRKDFAIAVKHYASVLSLYPGDVDMRLGLGWSFLGVGKKTDAAAAFREVQAMVPGSAGAAQGLEACR